MWWMKKYTTQAEAKSYRLKFSSSQATFLEIRTESGLSQSGLEQLLTGYTFKKAGGPVAASFVGIEVEFPDEKKRSRSWRKKYMRRYNKDRRTERWVKAVEMLGGACTECGSKDNLQFDHIDPSTKKLHIGQQITGSWPEIEAELQKCQLLCYPCHKIKSAKESSDFNRTNFVGEDSPRAKITNEDVEGYRTRFKAGELNMHEIAAETSMAVKNVRLMLRGITYRRAGGHLASAAEAINYITPERRARYLEQVACLHESGTTKPHEICKKVPVSGHTAKAYLLELGLVPGGQNHNAKLTDEQVRGYRKMFRDGLTRATEIASETGLSVKGVYQMLKGQTYRSVR